MPSARVVLGFQPSVFMRLTSSSFWGVPSGFVVSKTSSPCEAQGRADLLRQLAYGHVDRRCRC